MNSSEWSVCQTEGEGVCSIRGQVQTVGGEEGRADQQPTQEETRARQENQVNMPVVQAGMVN